ncbi:MAG TPA: hypothetical protein GX710_08625 [Clostridiales bacterium]|nr:hypothetical protein [Clostridiales bacterium]
MRIDCVKKLMKILVVATAIAIIGSILWFANGFLGNPVSKILAKNAAKNYIAETYADRDFIIEDINYNFKDMGYYAHVKSPSSKDTYFSVSISMLGKIKYDSYENVLDGWNTYRRIEDEYRQMVNSVFSSAEFPLVSNIDYGTIEIIEKDTTGGFDEANYGIKMGDLELDKEYNIKELAKAGGHIVFYAQDDEISFKKASEILLTLKELLNKADVPFYAVDFVLEKPRHEDETPNKDRTTINTVNFLYSDIYEEGLDERIEQEHNALRDYYAEQDAKGG